MRGTHAERNTSGEGHMWKETHIEGTIHGREYTIHLDFQA